MTAKLVLASQSPRRRELLGRFGVAFDIVRPGVDEMPMEGENPSDYALRTAADKGREVAGRVAKQVRWVLSADTVVSIGGRILGKPVDPGDARSMLHRLSGRIHSVYTGVVLIDRHIGTTLEGLDETRVWFRSLTGAEIDAYVGAGAVMDKAGAYAIQESASALVPRILGNYSNVVGLPMPVAFDLLRKAGVLRGG